MTDATQPTKWMGGVFGHETDWAQSGNWDNGVPDITQTNNNGIADFNNSSGPN